MSLRVFFVALTVVMSTVFVVVVAEIGLRLVFSSGVSQVVDPSEVAFEFHDRYLVALKNSVTKTFPGEETISWRSNRDGFRGEELRDADSRVMVYGDSNVMARFSSRENSFVGQLGQHLSADLSRDIEMVNAGVVGFGPDQSFLKIQSDLDRFRPDLVVLHIFADNDFGDSVRNRLFDLDAEGRLVETRHPRRPDPRFTGDWPFWSSLFLVRAYRKIFDPYWNASTLTGDFENYRSGGEQVASHFSDVFDADLALYPDSPQSRAKRALMDAILRELASWVASKDVALVVVVQPATFDLTTNMSPNFENFASVASYRPTNLSSFATASAEAADIPVVNLFEVFRSNDPSELYFKDSDNHWNDRGQALAAREVANFIVENDLL